MRPLKNICGWTFLPRNPYEHVCVLEDIFLSKKNRRNWKDMCGKDLLKMEVLLDMLMCEEKKF